MAMTLIGPMTWGLSSNDEGQRTYKVTYKVKATLGTGPAAIRATPGLPLVGSYWSVMGDSDLYAFRTPLFSIAPLSQEDDEPFEYWKLEYNFSTKSGNRCQDTDINDPLAEPDRYGGSFVTATEQALKDKDGNQIKSISGHPLRGPNVEFDANRPTVWIEQNRAQLGLSTFASMIDTVNGSPMWGLNKRCIKLSNVSWERKVQGTCEYYYTRRLEFDIRYDSFDKQVEDWSEFVLKGHWPASGGYVVDAGMSVSNPSNWVRYMDRSMNPSVVALTSSGTPATTQESINIIDVKKYSESNFYNLGVPSSF